MRVEIPAFDALFLQDVIIFTLYIYDLNEFIALHNIVSLYFTICYVLLIKDALPLINSLSQTQQMHHWAHHFRRRANMVNNTSVKKEEEEGK